MKIRHTIEYFEKWYAGKSIQLSENEKKVCEAAKRDFSIEIRKKKWMKILDVEYEPDVDHLLKELNKTPLYRHNFAEGIARIYHYISNITYAGMVITKEDHPRLDSLFPSFNAPLLKQCTSVLMGDCYTNY